MNIKNITGIHDDIILRYEIEREENKSPIYVNGDFFMQTTSPQGLPTIAKNIIFVIDQSGSMQGDKAEQAQEALLRMLDKLNEDDRFQLMFFSDDLVHWPTEPMPDGSDLALATTNNIVAAKNFVQKSFIADGSTNIEKALIESIFRLKLVSKNDMFNYVQFHIKFFTTVMRIN